MMMSSSSIPAHGAGDVWMRMQEQSVRIDEKSAAAARHTPTHTQTPSKRALDEGSFYGLGFLGCGFPASESKPKPPQCPLIDFRPQGEGGGPGPKLPGPKIPGRRRLRRGQRRLLVQTPTFPLAQHREFDGQFKNMFITSQYRQHESSTASPKASGFRARVRG